MAKERPTVQEVLRCDGCGHDIDDIGMAMIVWWSETRDQKRRPVSQLMIAHKAPECSAKGPRIGAMSQELGWFASSDGALAQLASLAYRFEWTAEQLQRLIGVTWAVPHAATSQQAENAERFSKIEL